MTIERKEKMIRQFVCNDGSVYAKADGYEATVDEVIEFLKQFRGKLFWNGAAGDVAFRLDDGIVCCDHTDFLIECAEEKDEALAEMIGYFFYNTDEEYATEENWRKDFEENDE
jgi:hypothetical protein